MEVCEGQQLDLDFESQDDVTEEMYLEMISSRHLFYLPLHVQWEHMCWRVTREGGAMV